MMGSVNRERPFSPGDFVVITQAVDQDIHDVSRFVGGTGIVVGFAQPHPSERMTLVDFGQQVEGFWDEEIVRLDLRNEC